MNTAPHKKLIILVISHQEYYYNKFKEQWLKYTVKFKNNIQVYFIYGKADFIPNLEYDLVFPNIEENYQEGLILKTVEALEWVNNNWDYDYIVRSNLSSKRLFV